MKRFRVTITAVCLLLCYLGYTKISFFLRNQELQQTAFSSDGTDIKWDREWVQIKGGYLLLEEALPDDFENRLNPDAIIIPLVANVSDDEFQVFVETKDKKLIERYKNYSDFGFVAENERAKYIEENPDLFKIRKDIKGIIKTGYAGDKNLKTIKDGAKEAGIKLTKGAFFIEETAEPPSIIGGVFMVVIAILGLIKVMFLWKKETPEKVSGEESVSEIDSSGSDEVKSE